MKKLCLLLVTVLAFGAFVACDGPSGGSSGNNAVSGKHYVRFMTNIPEEEITLSNGHTAVADNPMFLKVEIEAGKGISEPATTPERDGYVFAGWSAKQTEYEYYNLADPIYSDVTLYANWERDEKPIAEEYVEPELSFKEKVAEGGALDLYGVLNMPIISDSVSLTTAGLKILSAKAANVKELLNYTVDANTAITQATYANKTITVNYTSGGQNLTRTVAVRDNTASLAVESTYETKAVKYENNVSIPPYSVVLAGSSSMENWATSTADMSPVTTCNVGIGGTTVEHWSQKLAKRLIYPFNPRAVVFYVGVNNIINNNKTGDQTGAALVELFDDVHSHLPEAQIYFILINKVPNYTSYYAEMDIANAYATRYAAAHDYLTLIDAGRPLVKASGVTNKAYFLSDGLHMSLCGYVIWGREVKEAFIKTEKELYK